MQAEKLFKKTRKNPTHIIDQLAIKTVQIYLAVHDQAPTHKSKTKFDDLKEENIISFTQATQKERNTNQQPGAWQIFRIVKPTKSN